MEVWFIHPHWQIAMDVYLKVSHAGFEVYFVGGCVRDLLLGQTPKDFDLCSSATPDQLTQIFSSVEQVGKSFGVARVVMGKMSIEVAQFRKDSRSTDGRRPLSVESATVQEDAFRRDFTVNALYFDLKSKKILDFVGGHGDLQRRVLRTVGDPQIRFQEDYLRLLRALRFAAQLGFSLDPETKRALLQNAQFVQSVARERVGDEMRKWIQFARPFVDGELLLESRFLQVLIPGWQAPAAPFTPEYAGAPDSRFAFYHWVLAGQWHLRAAFSKAMYLTAKEINEISRLSVLFDDVALGQPAARPLLAGVPPAARSQQDRVKGWSACRQWPLGQLVELSFDPVFFWGFKKIYNSSKDPIAQEVLGINRHFGSGPPAPLLRAADILHLAQGPTLGECLRRVYWQQLERSIQHKEEALKWCHDFLSKYHR